MGVPVCNSAKGIASSRDKLRCLQLMALEGLLIPRTVMAHDRSNLARLVEEVGGLPAIIKLIRGTQGVGVMIAHPGRCGISWAPSGPGPGDRPPG
jgi:ribosomal protein S6--L-glutamate ligase